MSLAVIVAGPVSAGNRLVASYFVRAGCAGKGSTDQPTDEQLPLDAERFVVVRHAHDLGPTLEVVRESGHDVRVVVVTREPFALAASQRLRGHVTGETDLELVSRFRLALEEILAMVRDLPALVISYEALVLHPFDVVRRMLAWCGLPAANLLEPIEVNDRLYSPVPYDANARRYGGGTEHHLRPEYGTELVWWPERGMGYYPVSNYPRAYDLPYFERYERYAATPQGVALTDQRVRFVEQYAGRDAVLLDIVDVGIGCGQFCRAASADGYDVNPVGVGWLKAHACYRNPYEQGAEVLTCWDALEHVPDPARLVARASHWVFVSIPIFESAEHVLRSKHYRKDEHFWYWTRAGLVGWFGRLGFELEGHDTFEIALGREDIHSFAFKRQA